MARPADRAGGRARMVELRAVEDGFPYYGSMKLADGVPYSHALLENLGVLVRPELLAQLELAVGDGLTIGSQRFTIRGVIETEPGRRLGAFSIGPRVFVDLADLEKTGLMGYGSRTAMQRLLKVPDAVVRPADRRPARRLQERVRARALVQGDRGRHRRGVHARRELPQPGRPGDRDPRRHRRVERDAGVRAAEDAQHRGAEVRRRALVAAARDLRRAGRRARSRRQRARRGRWPGSRCARFRRCWPAPRRASRSTTR